MQRWSSIESWQIAMKSLMLAEKMCVSPLGPKAAALEVCFLESRTVVLLPAKLRIAPSALPERKAFLANILIDLTPELERVEGVGGEVDGQERGKLQVGVRSFSRTPIGFR